MATDPNPELRAELEAHLGFIEPQIVGFEQLETDSNLSKEAVSLIRQELIDRRRRVTLVTELLVLLNAAKLKYEELIADGYPGMEKGQMPPAIAAEIAAQQAAYAAAFGQLEPLPIAANVIIDLGTPVTKP